MELLAPAGCYEIGLEALYQGADAIYLGLDKFGARASATNFSLDELAQIVKIAHALDKKVYVTLNTIIKENELKDAFALIDEIAERNTDGIIVCDLGLVRYILNHYKTLECHISTQTGVKSVEDAKFFKSIGVKRVVLAREVDLETIKQIKKEVDIELEVFVHGSLCVSYSGACYMSSFLSTRSANRGRCKQNCRHTYSLLEDGKVVAKDLKLLSMKDLNTLDYIEKLKPYVDSFKIEGRMKDINYVSKVVKTYRAKLDGKSYNSLDSVFHRNYTAGFLNKASLGEVVYSKGNKNIGASAGVVLGKDRDFYKIKASLIKKGDRLRFITSEEDYYLEVTKLYDQHKKEVDSLSGIGYLRLNNPKITLNTAFYKVAKQSEAKVTTKLTIPLTLYFDVVDNYLYLTTTFKDRVITIKHDSELVKGSNVFLTEDSLLKQFNKLFNHPFIVSKIILNFSDKYFLTFQELNKMRSKLLEELYFEEKRHYKQPFSNLVSLQKPPKIAKILTVNCFNNYQREEALKYLAADQIYLKGDNYFDYHTTKLKSDVNVKGDTYGSICLYPNLEALGYYFNVINSEALRFLNEYTNNAFCNLALECSKDDLAAIYNSYLKKYQEKPNIDFLVYGKAKLMTLKYCPLNHLNKCAKCKDHTYHLKDDWSYFRLLHDGCKTHLLNQKPTFLIDDLDYILKYSSRLVLDFTDETPAEVAEIIKLFIQKLKDSNPLFNTIDATRGLFNRKIK